MRHELFEELDAFDPDWQRKYHNIYAAIRAAAEETPYIMDLAEDYAKNPRDVDYVPDYKMYIEEMQKAEEESSLPYKLNNIGSAPRGE